MSDRPWPDLPNSRGTKPYILTERVRQWVIGLCVWYGTQISGQYLADRSSSSSFGFSAMVSVVLCAGMIAIAMIALLMHMA